MGAAQRRIDRDSPMPLWSQVRSDVMQRIQRGEFAGSFPGEHELVQEYQVSRHTVREALRSLRADGILDGGRGRPTRVAEPEIRQTPGTLYSLFASVRDAGRQQRSLVRTLEVRTDPASAERLGLPETAALFYLERVRLSDDEPLAHDCVWMPAQVASPLLEADFAETSLYAELGRLCGVSLTGGRERVRADIPTADERHLLGLGDTVAVLRVERLGESGGRLLEWRRTTIRGDRFAFNTDLATPDRLTVSSDDAGAGP